MKRGEIEERAGRTHRLHPSPGGIVQRNGTPGGQALRFSIVRLRREQRMTWRHNEVSEIRRIDPSMSGSTRCPESAPSRHSA